MRQPGERGYVTLPLGDVRFGTAARAGALLPGGTNARQPMAGPGMAYGPASASDLALLLASWELALRAERRSRRPSRRTGTVSADASPGPRSTTAPPTWTAPTVAGFVADRLDAGAEASTARSRQLAVRRFSRWLEEEGQIERDPLGLAPPKLDQKVYEPLTDAQVRAMVAACAGLGPFRDRRDEALVRFMVDTGSRAGQVAVMKLSDLQLPAGTALVRRGKGGKGRSVPFGPQTTRALNRYIPARRTHRLAGTDALWLGDRGKEFSYWGLHKTLGRRARRAGI